MNLSVVIPVYNEAHKIIADLASCSAWLDQYYPDSEIIVVDDGSVDGTPGLLSTFSAATETKFSFISIPENRGKGYAVKQGILASSGNIVLFADSGSCIPWSDVDKGISMVNSKKTEICHASRYLPASKIMVERTFPRRLISFLFRKTISTFAGTPSYLTDTQCGLKIYDREAAITLYTECLTERFMFDVEIIFGAVAKGYRITEFPVSWTPDPDSRLKIFPTLLSTLREIREIRRRKKSKPDY
jgi:hypothetical protein